MSEDKNLKDNEQNMGEDLPKEIEIDNEENNSIIENTEDIKIDKKNNTIKSKTIIITTLVGILCLGVGFVYGKEVGRKLPLNSKSYSSSKVIATIGETNITGADIQKKMDPLFHIKGKEVMTEEEIKAYEASMIDYMTTTEMLYLEGKGKKIEATKDEINKEYDGLMTNIEQTFSMTKDEFLKKFKLTEEVVKTDLEKEIIASKYMAKVSEVSDEEVKNYYDKNKNEFLQVKASHILLKKVDDEGNDLSEEEVKKNKEEAQKILDNVKAGGDFTALAKEYSQDVSASNGGDLGFFSKGQMVEEFEKAAFGLKVGEISNKIVESKFGYHIIKKTDEQYEELENIQEELKKNLSYEKQNNLISDLTEKYNIEVKEK
ncbi:MAG: peptidylprolyl isomerase [Romboutsia sp.]